jgi:hypothetical protein
MREPIPLACSLTAEDQAERQLEFATLAESVVAGERTEDGARFHFRRAPGFAERLTDLTRRENQCCPFFDFRIKIVGDEILLEVGAPPEARPIVERLSSLVTR